MLKVYFINGQQTSFRNVVRAEIRPIQVVDGQMAGMALACYDKDNKLIGQFVTSQIVGYTLEEA